MKTFMILGLIVVANTVCAQAGTVCSNASGEVQYRESGYEKGIPPRPGDVLSTTQILIKGQVVSESKTYQNLNSVFGPISAGLSEQNVLENMASPSGSNKTYSAKLDLVKNSSSLTNVQDIDLPYSDYVICKEIFRAVP